MSRLSLYCKSVVLFLTTVGLWNGCVYLHPNIQTAPIEEIPPFSSQKLRIVKETIRKGYGVAEIMYAGEKVRGDFDLDVDEENNTKLVLYSFFGTEIANISCNNDSIKLHLQGEEFNLSSKSLLDTLEYFENYKVSALDFMELLRGGIPESFLNYQFLPLLKQKKLYTTTYEYIVASKERKIRFLLRFDRLIRIIFVYSVEGNSFIVTQSHFENGRPRQITLKADEKNYFKVEYKKILKP